MPKIIEKIRLKHSLQKGFSFIELLITITITLIIVGLAFTLLAHSLSRKMRDETQVSALADSSQSLNRMTLEIMNAGFGLNNNGLIAADCLENKIRVRANLNSLMKETTSNKIADPDEDVIFQLVPNPEGGSALVRTDVVTGITAIIATRIDDEDLDGDGDGDGLTFLYFDANGNQTAPQNAVRVEIRIQIILPQIGQPNAPGFQPEITKQLSSTAVLRNSRLPAY